MDHDTELLTTSETATFLRLKPQTLRMWRYRGGGPRYLKIGNRVIYRRKDVNRWLAERVRQSTSDPGTAETGG